MTPTCYRFPTSSCFLVLTHLHSVSGYYFIRMYTQSHTHTVGLYFGVSNVDFPFLFYVFSQQIAAAFPVTHIWTEFYFLFQRSRKTDLNSSAEAAELFISLTLCQLPHLCRGMFYSFISFRDLLCTCFYH